MKSSLKLTMSKHVIIYLKFLERLNFFFQATIWPAHILDATAMVENLYENKLAACSTLHFLVIPMFQSKI